MKERTNEIKATKLREFEVKLNETQQIQLDECTRINAKLHEPIIAPSY